jgi:hypothetical protein
MSSGTIDTIGRGGLACFDCETPMSKAELFLAEVLLLVLLTGGSWEGVACGTESCRGVGMPAEEG